MRKRRALTFLVSVIAAACGLALAQSPITFQYFYDDSGQLIKVVDSTGISIEYVYDAVGNMLEIKRSTTPVGGLSILSVTPARGGPLSRVEIRGTGFNPVLALNEVRFNGTIATVVAATATSLTVTVPASAATGLLSVKVGTSTAPGPVFQVVALPVILSVTPRAAAPGTSVKLRATGINLSAASLSLLPAFLPTAITIGNLTIQSDGKALSADLAISAAARGTFTAVATTAPGSSDGFASAANSINVLVPTDKIDSDGDGFPDGMELYFGSDPLDPLNVPMMSRVVPVSIVNHASPQLTTKGSQLLTTAISVLNRASPQLTTKGQQTLATPISVFNGGVSSMPIERLQVLSIFNGPPVLPQSLTASVFERLNLLVHGEADWDGDGLANREEFWRGTDATRADSDNDGLTDAEELYRYRTDPLNPDSDGDRFSDGDEVRAGSDPNNPRSRPGFRPIRRRSSCSCRPSRFETTQVIHDEEGTNYEADDLCGDDFAVGPQGSAV